MVRVNGEKAVYLARSGRPGPVWVDIPLDVQAVMIDPAALPPFEPAPETVLAEQQQLRGQVTEADGLIGLNR